MYSNKPIVLLLLASALVIAVVCAEEATLEVGEKHQVVHFKYNVTETSLSQEERNAIGRWIRLVKISLVSYLDEVAKEGSSSVPINVNSLVEAAEDIVTEIKDSDVYKNNKDLQKRYESVVKYFTDRITKLSADYSEKASKGMIEMMRYDPQEAGKYITLLEIVFTKEIEPNWSVDLTSIKMNGLSLYEVITVFLYKLSEMGLEEAGKGIAAAAQRF